MLLNDFHSNLVAHHAIKHHHFRSDTRTYHNISMTCFNPSLHGNHFWLGFLWKIVIIKSKQRKSKLQIFDALSNQRHPNFPRLHVWQNVGKAMRQWNTAFLEFRLFGKLHRNISIFFCIQRYFNYFICIFLISSHLSLIQNGWCQFSGNDGIQ